MALINCPACESEISDKSDSCIHCGHPINSSINSEGEQNLEYNEFCECGANPPNWSLIDNKRNQNYFRLILGAVSGLIGLIFMLVAIFGIASLSGLINPDHIDNDGSIKVIGFGLLVGAFLCQYSYKKLFENPYKTFRCLNCNREREIKVEVG